MWKSIVVLYYLFSEKTYSDIKNDFNISKTVSLKIKKKLGERYNNFITNNRQILGGNNVICQIDESMFSYKQKYHRGRIPQENRWVFGIIESGPQLRYFVKIVPNRSKDVLFGLISQNCAPGTIIWSDEWRGYADLNVYFDHLTVNHSINFVNPINGVNTQKIESLWSKLKKKKGIGKGKLKYLLNEWMWLDMYGKKYFNNLLNLLI